MNIAPTTNVIKKSLLLVFILGAFLAASQLFLVTNAQAATDTSTVRYNGGGGGCSPFCPEAIWFDAELEVTIPDVVSPGATFQATGIGRCDGDDESGTAQIGGFIIGEGSLAYTTTRQCPSNIPAPTGSVDITAPTTPGNYCLDFYINVNKINPPSSYYLIQPKVNGQVCYTVPAPATYDLTVRADGGDTTVDMIGSNGGTNGTTEYTITGLSGSAGPTIEAPAVSDNGSTFVNWSGCSTVAPTSRHCIRGMSNSDRTITATYAAPVTRTLTVNSQGASSVNITGDYNVTTNDSVSGISDGAGVSITAPDTVGAGSPPRTFLGWTGCNSTGGSVGTMGFSRTCNVTMSSNKTVTANYSPSYNLSSDDGSTVTNTRTDGQTIRMTWTSSGADSCEAQANSYGFSTSGNTNSSDWTTALSSAASPIVFRMRCTGAGGTGPWDSRTITVNPPPNYNLTVSKNGTGAGTVTSVPAGINCGADCSQSYSDGTNVTLSASPSGGSTFAGWSGSGCSGTGSCVVNMSAARAVTATFNLSPINGVCGSADGNNYYSQPASNLCSVGSVSWTDTTVPFGDDWNWNCLGSNGGSNDACSAGRNYDASCGSSNGGSFSSAPASNLCSVGTIAWTDNTGGDGTYNWNCNGAYAGSDVSCSATRLFPVNGVCGTRDTNYAYDVTSWPGGSSYCSAGNPSASPSFPAQSSSVNWICFGQNGGSDSPQCTASRDAAPGCGSAAGGTYTSQPASNLCTIGSASWTDTTGNDGTFNWTCGGTSCVANHRPDAPTGLSATPQACGTGELNLDWNNVAGASSYSVYLSDNTWVGNTGGSDMTPFTGNPGQTYTFYVRANSPLGIQSANSSNFSGTVPSACPSSDVTFSATPATGASGYTTTITFNDGGSYSGNCDLIGSQPFWSGSVPSGSGDQVFPGQGPVTSSGVVGVWCDKNGNSGIDSGERATQMLSVTAGPYNLNVNTTNISSVPMTSNPGGYGGTSNYSVLSIPAGTTIDIIAPPVWAGQDFSMWTGCDSTSGSDFHICTISMNSDETVTADYVPPTPTCSLPNTADFNTISGQSCAVVEGCDPDNFDVRCQSPFNSNCYANWECPSVPNCNVNAGQEVTGGVPAGGNLLDSGSSVDDPSIFIGQAACEALCDAALNNSGYCSYTELELFQDNGSADNTSMSYQCRGYDAGTGLAPNAMHNTPDVLSTFPPLTSIRTERFFAGSCDGATLPECSDGIDNDWDGDIDFPADAGCSDANDDDEYNGALADWEDDICGGQSMALDCSVPGGAYTIPFGPCAPDEMLQFRTINQCVATGWFGPYLSYQCSPPNHPACVGTLPAVNFTNADMSPTIDSGNNVTLEWESTYADDCTITEYESGVATGDIWTSSPNSGATPVTGSLVVGPLTVASEYSISCTNGTGISPATPDVVVTINAGGCSGNITTSGQTLTMGSCTNGDWNTPFINQAADWARAQGVPEPDVQDMLADDPFFTQGGLPDTMSTLNGSNSSINWAFWKMQGNAADVVPCAAGITVSCAGGGNVPPVANAGPDRVIDQPTDTSNADGSASSDPDDGIASYSWAQVGVTPSVATIVDGATANPTFNNLTDVGVYTFRLTVTDNSGATDTDDMTVTVQAVVCTTGPMNGPNFTYVTAAMDTCDGDHQLFSESENAPPPPVISGVSCRDYQCPGCNAGHGFKDWARWIDVTCGGVSPPTSPSAAIGVRINGGSLESTNQTIEVTDTIEIEWGSSDAAGCVVTDGAAAGFATGGAADGTIAVPTPAQNTTQRYGINCDGAFDTIDIEVNPLPNLTGGVAFTNLVPELDGLGNLTGNYTDVEVTVPLEEQGGRDVTTPFVVRAELDVNDDGSIDDFHEWNIASINANESPAPLQYTFTGLTLPVTPQSRIWVYVDYDPNDPDGIDGVILESDENNTYDNVVPAGLPAPTIDLTIVPSDFVRGGQTAEISWDTNAVFPMTCDLDGPAIAPITFDPSDPADGPTGSVTTGPILAKSVYTLSCQENVTNTEPPYEATTEIETTGTVEET